MREMGLSARQGRPRTPRATDSGHDLPIAPNGLGAKLRRRTGGDQVWLADISYKPTGEGWLYLAAIKDMATRQIVGWSMTELKADLCIDALVTALQRCQPGRELIHHSDRGVQGGIKWSSQHEVCCPIGATGQAPLRVFSTQVSFGAGHSGRPPRRQWRRHCVR